MIVMIRLILSSLCLTTVNCQFTHIWLNYNLFQCEQNARNYLESIHHQYFCAYSVIRTCISDVNEYSHSSVTVPQSFCGFIAGQNALQRHTVWNIRLKPNINIHFLKFVLFDYYWYCDHEYLRVSGNSKSDTFCGNRLPWVHDAAATSVNIILITHVQRAGAKDYHLQLLYYAAYVSHYNHYIVYFSPSYTVMGSAPFLYSQQNVLKSIHYIFNNMVGLVAFEVKNTCSKSQVVCYDGPGVKSPVLRIRSTYNQSVWRFVSSTFQMMCTFSRVDDVCTNVLLFRTPTHNVSITTFLKTFRQCPSHPLEINNPKSIGTTKYIYYYDLPFKKRSDCMIRVIKTDISFPYMLTEGNGCMYGGVYIGQYGSNKLGQYGSDMLSLCTSSFNVNKRMIAVHGSVVIIIHYSEYSTERMLFYAEHSDFTSSYNNVVPSYPKVTNKEDTLSIRSRKVGRVYLHSSLFRLRKIHYINISVNHHVNMKFDGQYGSPCVNITISYPTNLTNMWSMLEHFKENG